MASLVGRVLGNKYRIVARLGRGGMAEVYKGHEPGLQRYVGIKVLHAHLVDEEGFIGRFEREAQAIARLRHPNIVQVIELGQEGDIYYMAMEFIDGPTLKDELKARKAGNQPLSFTQISLIFTALCSAVDYAHSRGMVHRDIKPANVMVNEEGQVILTDFGIARIMGATQYTQTGALSGTPAYMSPEQGQGERGDERSDIYALGVMLYEMATGMVPYDADTPFAVIMKHISEPLPPPSQMNPEIPEAVEQVIMKAMAKDPDDRYQTAGEMARALREAVQVSPYETLQSSPLTTIAPPPKIEQIDHPTGPITEAERTYSATAPNDIPTVWSGGGAASTVATAPTKQQLPLTYIGVGAVVLVLIIGGIITTLVLSSTSSEASASETASAIAVESTSTAENLATATAREAAETMATQTAEAATVTAQAPTQTAQAATAEAERIAGGVSAIFQTVTAEAGVAQTATAEAVASAETATAVVVSSFTPTPVPTDTPLPTNTPPPTNTPTPVPVVAAPPNTPTPAVPTDTPVPERPPIPGGKLAFPVDDGGGKYDVFIVSMPDGKLINQIKGARQPNFRSDGQKLLVNGEGGSFGENIFQADASGNIEKPVSGSPTDSFPFYKNDGTTLAYSNPELAVGSDGARHSFLFVQCSLKPPSQESDKCVEMSQWNLIVPAGQIGEVQGAKPVWTSPGDHLAYAGCNTWEGGGRCGMYSVGSWATKRVSNGENPILLVDGTSVTPTDAKDGLISFMSRESGDWEAFVIPETGGTPVNVSNSPGSDDGVPTISPDGNWVAFASNREGAWAIWVAPSNGSQAPQKLFNFPKANPWGVGDHDWSNERMSWGP